MWLFTRHGFYSVVRDKSAAEQLQVRARVKDDLERLRRFARGTGIELPDVISTPHADYAHRLVIERAAWLRLAAALADDVDYVNFKNEVHGERDRDDAYLRVWSVMNELQHRRKE